ncbi:MAG: HAD family hydrolase [Streptosporangiaceae bacterium]
MDRGELSWLGLPSAPTIGFDLDLTLIDTTAATAHTLDVVARDLGLQLDIDGMLARRGRPFRELLAEAVPPASLTAAMRRFFRVFLAEGIPMVRPIEGAGEALAKLRAAGGRSVVITGRRASSAWRCLRELDLRVDDLCGGVTGPAKAPLMTSQGVDAFVGDHVLDMVGARIAQVPGVGVLSGGHGPAELREAGACVVIPSVAVGYPQIS